MSSTELGGEEKEGQGQKGGERRKLHGQDEIDTYLKMRMEKNLSIAISKMNNFARMITARTHTQRERDT